MPRQSFPIAIIVATLISLSPVAIPMSEMPQITGSVHVAAAQDVGEVLELQPGVTVTVLSSEVVDSLPGGDGGRLVLDRVSLPPGSTMSAVLAGLGDQPGVPNLGYPNALRLVYVNSGRVTMLGIGNETTYESGEQILLSSEADFDVRNDTSDCASLLLLTIDEAGMGGGFGAEVGGPSLPALEDCPTPRRLTDWNGASGVAGPARLFLARVTWDPQGYGPGGTPGFGPIAHFGPVALVVETGVLDFPASTQLREFERPFSQNTLFLAPDSYAWIPARSLYSIYYPTAHVGAEFATALLVGVVPDDQQWFTPLDFTSSAYGYGLSWDYPWQATGETRVLQGFNRYHWLRLENGTSTVLFEDYAGHEGHSVRCLDELISALEVDTNVVNLQLAQRDGRPVEERGVTRAFAQYSYSLTDATGSTQELVKHMECRTLVSDEAVITISAFMPRGDLEVQRQALEELLAGLVLP